MGYSRIEIIDDPLDGMILIAEGETAKGGAYVAKITDTDPKYRYKREFMGTKQHSRTHVLCKVPVADIQEGDVLEIRAGGSWKNDYRDFYLFSQGGIKRLSETEMRAALATYKKGH